MAPLVKSLAARSAFELRVLVTAQHREMLDQVLTLFDIKPDYDLDVMRPGQDLYDIISGVLYGTRDVLRNFKPDLVLVHGDTATTFAASLAAFYEQIKIGHIEAGLRTNDLMSPWPEEANRQLTGRLALWHFAPTDRNKKALVSEGINGSNVLVTGNTVVDALQWLLREVEACPRLKSSILDQLESSGLSRNVLKKKYVLVTGHRRENFGFGLENICNAIRALSISHGEVHFIYPVHLNPNVKGPVSSLLSGKDNIHLISPLGYEAFVYLMQGCHIVLTDSGGVQEEAPSLGKPVLVMRENTERPEAVEAGTVLLVGTSTEQIIRQVSKLLVDDNSYETMARAHNPYGDGSACNRIADFLEERA
jgi:UDP-N-acetylglucosamine 2-epimerase (non-hydrolysing)